MSVFVGTVITADSTPVTVQRAMLMRWLPARAHDNGLFLVFANGIGVDDDEIRTGNSMILDPYGRVRQSIPRHQIDALPAQYGFRDDITFYTDHGDVFAWLCVLLSVIVLAWSLKAEIKQIASRSGTSNERR